MSPAQIAATVIFIIMLAAVISGRVSRYVPALIAAGLTLLVVFLLIMREPAAVISVLNVAQIGSASFWLPGHTPFHSSGVNWQTLIFIAGMMVMVEGLNEVGFFRWLSFYVAKKVNYRVMPLFAVFMFLSGFLAMFIDSITVLLFLAATVIELARLLRFNPVPVIVAMILAANIGGSATMSGDPPNIIIGTAFGFTFTDFLTNTGPIAWAGMVITLGITWLQFRKELKDPPAGSRSYPEPSEAITDRSRFRVYVTIFIVVIALLVTHAESGLSVASIGAIAAILSLGAAGKETGIILSRTDWRTLLFFFGLFVTVGGLEEAGVLRMLADLIGGVSGGSLDTAIALILWVSAFASAVVDNIPFAAAMVPVIADLSQAQGFSLRTLSWTLALGADIGGNATPIGASANIVGTAKASQEGYHIGWGTFLKASLPATLLVIGACHIYLLLRY